MEYKENVLDHEVYCVLRECVGWLVFLEEQVRKAIEHSLYTVIAVRDDETVGI